MKTALAIVCSLLLVWTNLVRAQAPEASGAGVAHSCCHHCGKSCCAAKDSNPAPPPVSAAPVSAFQTQFAPLAPVLVVWTLPNTPVLEAPFCLYPPVTSARATLFARDCAWLI